MDTPMIRISDSRHSPHSISSALPQESLPLCEIRRRSPSPSPASSPVPSPCPSPKTQKETLTLPPLTHQRADSCASYASSVTLAAVDSPSERECDTVLGGVLTAEPGHITPTVAEDDVSQSRLKRRVCIAATPVECIWNWRYYNREKIQDSRVFHYSEIPARCGVPSRPTFVGGWESLIHPEGSVYFRFENFYTNGYLYDETKRLYMDAAVKKLREEISQNHPDLSMKNIEIGIDTWTDEEGDELACYYICDMVNEEVFWLGECVEGFYNTNFPHVKIISREHLSLAAHALFWDHVFMFPHGRTLTQQTLHKIQGDLCFLMYDQETSPESTCPYSVDELHRVLQTIKDLSRMSSENGKALPQQMAILGRLQSYLVNERFTHYYGERYAQLVRSCSVYEESQQTLSWWFTCATWLFFFTPQTYLRRLRRVWVDKIVNFHAWNKLIAELQEDLAASITPSAVILTANVGFLAIQSVDQGGQAASDRTAAQVISYMSTMLSIGNIFACTILARQHRPSTYLEARDAANYFYERTKTAHGMEKLAIVMSIPTAFFLWALLTFFMAISWVCFYNTNVATRVIIGFTLVVSVILLCAVMHNGDWQAPQGIVTLREKMKRTRGLIRKVKKAPKKMSKMGKKLRTFSLDALATLSPRRRSSPSETTCKSGDSLHKSGDSWRTSGDSTRKSVESTVKRIESTRKSAEDMV